jgi:hypothetical protein
LLPARWTRNGYYVFLVHDGFSFFVGRGGLKVLQVIAVENLDILFFPAQIILIQAPESRVRGGYNVTNEKSIKLSLKGTPKR